MTIGKIPLLTSAAAAGALCLALGMGPAFAAGNSGMSSPGSAESSGSAMGQESALFAALDTNNDGKISHDEMQRIGNLQENFTQADVDQSGSLDRSEFSAFEAQGPSGSSTAEMSKASALFSALDTNHDGTLSQDELKPAENLLANFDQADTNHDGSIEQSEFSAFEAKASGAGEPQEQTAPKEGMPED